MRAMFHFIQIALIVVELWMNDVLQVPKMVLLLEQCAFIVKRYFETYSLKRVRNDFIQDIQILYLHLIILMGLFFQDIRHR